MGEFGWDGLALVVPAPQTAGATADPDHLPARLWNEGVVGILLLPPYLTDSAVPARPGPVVLSHCGRGGVMEQATRPPRLFGRNAEITRVAEFLAGVREGPSALVIVGEPGIGKTALWSHVLARLPPDFRVLRCRPAESEVKVPYAALADLLAELPGEALDSLPPPQRRGLDVALLKVAAPEESIDRRTVSTALLGILRALASRGPVILAIDDVQWLDVTSARALEFALRRLDSEPVAVLATHRLRSGQAPLDLQATLAHREVVQLELGPLDVDSTDLLLQERAGRRFLLPAIVQVHRMAGGNPFYFLEIARALADGDLSVEAGESLPVPRTLRDLLKGRLDRLPRRVRELLPFVASTSVPTVGLLDRVIGTGAGATLDRAIASGILERDGDRLTFVHPLLASVVYSELTAEQRRALHARLGRAVPDREEQAMHLALSATGPDARVADLLDDGARRAQGRGAPDAAAELLELARRLTLPGRKDQAIARAIAAADCHFGAGNVKRALELLEDTVSRAGPGPRRAEALRLMGMILAVADGWAAAGRVFRRALRDAEPDSSTRAGIERGLAYAGLFTGTLSTARRHARRALDLSREAERSELAESLQALAYIEFMLSDRHVGPRLARALAVEKELERGTARRGSFVALRHVLRPSYVEAQILKYSDRLSEARARFKALLRGAEEEGDESAIQPLLCHLAELECWAGDWIAANGYAQRGLTLALQTGMPFYEQMARYAQALVDARRGAFEQARAAAERGLFLATAGGEFTTRVQNLAVLGFLALASGDPREADVRLRPALELVEGAGVREPGVFRFHADAVEAMVLVGDLDRAERVVAWLEQRARAGGSAWARAASARGRALLTSVEGDPEAGMVAFAEAVARHESLDQPFELARTLLLAGIAARRSRRKAEARSGLERAIAIFDELGAGVWAEKGRLELLRIGRRPPDPWALTETEEQVATLVGSGHTNTEVARALFMSPKTVEWNLSKIYRKLRIRSRTELAARLRDLRPVEDRGAAAVETGDSPGSSPPESP
jgi:DNA-binding CsgD family transcriptional regulator